MASIGDLVFGQLLGQGDPRRQIIEAMQAGGGGVPGAPQAQPGVGTPGAGGGQPGMQPQRQQPEVTRTPPDLMELYLRLQERQEKNAILERGLGMIGSAFAQPENKDAVRSALYTENGALAGGGGSGGGGGGNFLENAMKIRDQNLALQQKAAQRAALPAIAKQYGLSLEAAQYLFDTGKLDSVIQDAQKPDKQIVQGNDGRSYIIDKRTGAMSEPLGPEKQREIELVTDDRGNQFPVWKDTKERVGATNLVDGQGASNLEREWRANNADRQQAGLPPRTFEEFAATQNQSRAGAGNLTAAGVNVGNPPTDMGWKRDEQGNVVLDENNAPVPVPLKNTKLEAEQKAAGAKASERAQRRRTDATTVVEELSAAQKMLEDNIDAWVPLTGAGSYAGAVRGTPQYDFQQALEPVKAIVSFERLQQMREASPTGGALGQVSDFENRLLQATAGSLDVGQRTPALQRNMRRILRLYGMVDDVLNAETMEKATALAKQLDDQLSALEDDIGEREPASGAEPEVDSILKKYLKNPGNE